MILCQQLYGEPQNLPRHNRAIGGGKETPADPIEQDAECHGTFEMGGANMASIAETEPSFENFFDLGILYSAGREVAADLIAAHKWFNLAAVKGNREAAAYRQEVAREMSLTEVAAAQRAARDWLRTH